MSIQVRSNSETPEQVAQALGQSAKTETEVVTSAAVEKTAETAAEESETSEVDASEELESQEENESKDESEPDDKPKKKNGFKKRIDKLRSSLTERERELEYWRQQALKGQQPQESKREEPQAKQEASSGKPTADQFETHAEFVEALSDWKVDQRLKQEREAKAAEERKAQEQKQVSTLQERIKSFKEAHDDFDDVVEEVDDIPMSITVRDVLVNAENGPELMYELAMNRKEYERICSLPAIQAARELGKLEARLAKSSEEKPEKPEVKTTKAPKPLNPIGAKAGTPSKSIFDASLSQKEYERLRFEQQQRRKSSW